MDYLFLFLSAFLAATIFPAQSEIILVSLATQGNHSVTSLFLVATFGNVLGSLVNWLLGFYLMKFKDRKWFPVKKSALSKAEKTYEKYGVWSLLFAWLPIVGDPLTLIAGVFKTNIWLFLALVTIGKALRYFVLLSVIS